MDINRYSVRLFTALVSASLLIGCATSGNKALKDENSASIEKKITKGKTTKEEVRSAFGDPGSADISESGSLKWRYVFTHTKPKPTNFMPVVMLFASARKGTKKELIILFDADGVVQDYSMSASDIEEKTGIFNK